MIKHWTSLSALALLALLFLALAMLNQTLLGGARADLTENRLYTLSPGTLSLLRSIEEPVTLSFYFSEESSREFPQVRAFARRVEELLEEMANRSAGQLTVERIDPRPFSDQEDEASRFGLEAIPTGRGEETLYLGLVGSNLLDGVEVLPFLSPAREPFLEYELARMIHLLSRPVQPRIGLISGLPLQGGSDPRTGQRSEPWVIYEQITQLFDVESISRQAEAIPDGLDVLVLVHPRELSDGLLQAIDRFALEGGRLLLFVDPQAESDSGRDPFDAMAAIAGERDSSLEPLFSAWGIEFLSDEFVGDLGQALQVTLQAGRPPVRHPGIIGVTRQHMNRSDVVTADLDAVNLASSGHFRLAEDSPLTMQPLLNSSPRAGRLDTERLRFLEDPTELAVELAPTGESFVLAARFQGTASTAFPDADGPEQGEIQLIAVADADLLADLYWVQRQRVFGSTLLDPFASNGDFVINAIDNLIGNADLISVRSRAISSRPFTLVEALRREAEQRLLATEQRLEAELAETERRLGELQQTRADADLTILSAEQEAEIDRFMDQRLEIRQQLRQVRRELDQDIEALGSRVKAVNIAAMPLLVTALALVLWVRRRRQAALWRERANS
ncbi:MAG: Gldg family protein [Wenzhouxiangella sp.]